MILLGFRYIKGNHNGAHLASIVMDMLEKYYLYGCLLAVTTDNASNNQTLMASVASRLNKQLRLRVLTLQSLRESTYRLVNQPYYLSCLAHVLQIAVYIFL